LANSEAISGQNTYLLYGEESAYNTAVAVNTHLGLVKNFKPNINNNIYEARGFTGTTTGGRNVVKFVPGKLELGFTADFDVTRWHFLKYVLGAEGGVGPYTYTEANIPASLTVAHNIDNPGGSAIDREETYSGVVFDTVTIRGSVGQPVSVSADCKAAKVVIDTTVSSAVALPDEDCFSFEGAAIAIGSIIASNIINSFEITVKNAWKIMYGLGSRLAVRALPKERSYTLKVNVNYIDNALMTAALGATTPTATGGPTETASVTFTFSKADRSNVMTFTGVPVSQLALMAELNNPYVEDCTLLAKSCSCADDRTA
jgi:hypothetical protein